MVPGESPWLHVWIATRAMEVTTCLDKTETAAMSRFVHLRDRTRYARAHSLKRRILADHYLREAPLRLKFGRQPQGKPFLLDHPLEFNLSHSEDAFALAVSNVPVGVDIQAKDTLTVLPDLAEAVFHPAELALWKRQDASTDLFFRLWAGKEAMVKAEGVGFLVDPRSFDCSAAVGAIGHVEGPTRHWHLCHAEQAQFAICTAVPADASPEVRWFQIDPYARSPRGGAVEDSRWMRAPDAP